MDAIAQRPAGSARAGRVLRASRIWLGAYVAVLAGIAFWPTHVDADARPFLASITELIPWLSYGVIEFTANILLFVPLGVLCTLVLRRRAVLVVPIALLVTVAIEAGQALLLPDRTAALSDIIANVAGAAVGQLLVLGVRFLRRRRAERTATSPTAEDVIADEVIG